MIARAASTTCDLTKEFVTRALLHAGALVEENGGALDTVVPSELAQRLAVPESTTLAFGRVDGAPSAAVPATFGSPFLERLSTLLRERGGATRLRLQGIYLKRQGLADALARTMSFPNAKLAVQSAVETSASYLVLHAHYRAASETREEGIFALCLNELSLLSVPALLEQAALDDAEPHAFAEAPARRPFAEILARAQALLAVALEAELAPYRAALERRRARDRERITSYFDDLVREQRRPSRGRGAPDDAELRADRIRTTLAARDMKLAELASRYAITVTVRAIGAKRVLLPVVAIPTVLRRGRDEITRRFFWNPVLKEVECAVCEQCCCTTRVLLVDASNRTVCKQCAT